MDLNGHHDKNILWPKAYFCIVSNHFILLERIGGVLVSFSEKNEIDGSDSKAKLELEKKTVFILCIIHNYNVFIIQR